MAEISSSVPESRTVADRLRGARRRWFVGRRAELELFRDALGSGDPAFSVLWVHGPGGVGKTTLLGAFADEAAALGCAPVVLDLRAIEPSPAAFATALARACGLPAGMSAADALAGLRRPVLLLDTLEAAPGLEGWLRGVFVPALPAGALTVIAGRARPGEDWRRDPGWRDLLRVVALRNLGPEDARALLWRGGVADELHERLLELTHGHPLALSLLLDVHSLRDDSSLDLGAVPDVVGRLVASFLAGVPSDRHRLALELAAHARFMTAGLLRAALGDDGGLFAWLRGLSFIESGPHGLFPHDLARDVIDADLRWRDPAAYARVHGHARREVVERLTSSEGFEHQRALADLMFLHRGNRAAPRFWDWESLGQVYADEPRASDRAPMLAMVERHEGAESASIAAYWLERQPWAFAPFRGRGSEPVGFLAQLSLQDAGELDRERDPATRAAWAHALRHAPPRANDEVLVGRFLMDRDAYQAPSRSFSVVTIWSTKEWLRRPRLSWYYLAFADPDAIAPLMAYIEFRRVPEADFEVGGRRYGVFARDWRREGATEWLERMGAHELGGEVRRPAPDAVTELALSQAEFAGAVRRALRDCCRPGDLAANPLTRARLVRDQGGAGEALRRLIEQAVDALRADPRDAKLARALERSYLKPAPTQEAAAELLGLPFSTYRGHLARGIERVTEWLWQRELYGPDSAASR